MIALINKPILNEYGNYRYKIINKKELRILLKDNKFISFIKDEIACKKLTDILGVNIEVSKDKDFKLTIDDIAIVFDYKITINPNTKQLEMFEYKLGTLILENKFENITKNNLDSISNLCTVYPFKSQKGNFCFMLHSKVSISELEDELGVKFDLLGLINNSNFDENSCKNIVDVIETSESVCYKNYLEKYDFLDDALLSFKSLLYSLGIFTRGFNDNFSSEFINIKKSENWFVLKVK